MSLFRADQVRKAVVAAAVAVSALAATLAIASPALASPSGDLVAATNASRSAAGLPALQDSSQLNAIAQSWATKLASDQTLAHNPNLSTQITDWSTIGENVGMGADVPTLEQAFMGSPAHKANILSSAFTQVGVGSATSVDPSCQCRLLWVVVDFKRSASAAPAPAPKPAPAKTAPVKTTPVKTTPVKTTPVETAPATTAPARPITAPTRPVSARAATASAAASVAAVVERPAALSAQIVDVDPTSGSAADPVSTVLDFASVLAALSSPTR